MKSFDYRFETGGKTYTLRYSFGARRAFEKQFGRTMPSLVGALSDTATQSAEDMILMFRLLLLSCHPEMSDDDIANMIEELSEDEAMRIMNAALLQQGGGEAGNPPTRGPTT
jgi:hypothetical protein